MLWGPAVSELKAMVMTVSRLLGGGVEYNTGCIVSDKGVLNTLQKEKKERKTAIVSGQEFQQDCGSVSASKWGTSPAWVRGQTGTGFCREFKGEMPGDQHLGRCVP